VAAILRLLRFPTRNPPGMERTLERLEADVTRVEP
jgi:hypothetical protein